MTQPAERLNLLAQWVGARRYLEIGVETGRTFFDVRAPYRVAVDPAFAFDPVERAARGSVFHQTTSDAFFAGLDLDQTFDLVFLDGLHHFEQTYRDLVNTLAHSHPRTVILIDDTVPTSLYSSQRERGMQAQELESRGLQGLVWHGDVYKMLVAIHDFHPTLDFVTITTDGNPQTLVWRSKARPRTPLIGSFEGIERLDYFEFKRLLPQLNAMSEETAMTYARRQFERLGWFAREDGVSPVMTEVSGA
jgi:hypothetical protein